LEELNIVDRGENKMLDNRKILPKQNDNMKKYSE
jgi:hypothetical protein